MPTPRMRLRTNLPRHHSPGNEPTKLRLEQNLQNRGHNQMNLFEILLLVEVGVIALCHLAEWFG